MRRPSKQLRNLMPTLNGQASMHPSTGVQVQDLPTLGEKSENVN